MTTWTPSDPALRQLLANADLTTRQREVYLLRTAGVAWRTIARAYQCSPQTIRDHHEAAQLKIKRAKGNMI